MATAGPPKPPSGATPPGEAPTSPAPGAVPASATPSSPPPGGPPGGSMSMSEIAPAMKLVPFLQEFQDALKQLRALEQDINVMIDKFPPDDNISNLKKVVSEKIKSFEAELKKSPLPDLKALESQVNEYFLAKFQAAKDLGVLINFATIEAPPKPSSPPPSAPPASPGSAKVSPGIAVRAPAAAPSTPAPPADDVTITPSLAPAPPEGDANLAARARSLDGESKKGRENATALPSKPKPAGKPTGTGAGTSTPERSPLFMQRAHAHEKLKDLAANKITVASKSMDEAAYLKQNANIISNIQSGTKDPNSLYHEVKAEVDANKNLVVRIPNHETKGEDVMKRSREPDSGKVNISLTVPCSDAALVIMFSENKDVPMPLTLKDPATPPAPGPESEARADILIKLYQASLLGKVDVKFGENDQKLLESHKVYMDMQKQGLTDAVKFSQFVADYKNDEANPTNETYPLGSPLKREKPEPPEPGTITFSSS